MAVENLSAVQKLIKRQAELLEQHVKDTEQLLKKTRPIEYEIYEEEAAAAEQFLTELSTIGTEDVNA